MNIAVIGTGPGGYVASLKAAQLGAHVTVVEKEKIGGACLNWGCIPTKSMLASAEVFRTSKRAGEFGIEIPEHPIPNLAKIIERKNKVIATQAKGIHALFKSWGVALIEGVGRIRNTAQIEVSRRDGVSQLLNADRIIIATGSRPAQIPAFPFDGERILSSNDILAVTSIPKSLIIIGAGVIGCEFACMFRELGTDITMLEIMPRPLMTEDHEISAIFEKELKKKRIKLCTGIKIVGVEKQEDGVHVFLENTGEVVAEKVLVSVGRSLNTEDIGIDAVGIKTGTKGAITVDERMETSVKGIYAVGDVVGGMLLAHVASKEGVIAAYNACGIERRMDYAVVPAVIFTSPEIGSVGIREHEAVEKGLPIKTGRFHFRALGKAHAMGEIEGMIKIISDAATDKVIGVHIIGPHASDLVHEGALAIRAGLTADDVGDLIHAHPTLSEGIMEAAEDVNDTAVHAAKK